MITNKNKKWIMVFQDNCSITDFKDAPSDVWHTVLKIYLNCTEWDVFEVIKVFRNMVLNSHLITSNISLSAIKIYRSVEDHEGLGFYEYMLTLSVVY